MMMQADFDKLLHFEQEAVLAEATLRQLGKEVEQQPWFQAAWLLLAKASFHQNSEHYNQVLSKAATYALDRSKLFEIVYQSDLMQAAPQAKVVEAPKVQKEEVKSAPKVEAKAEDKSKEEFQKKIAERLKQIQSEEKETEEKVAPPLADTPKQEVSNLTAVEEETIASQATDLPEKSTPTVEEETITLEETKSSEEQTETVAEELQKEEVSAETITTGNKVEPTLEEENKMIDELERERMQEKIIDRFLQKQPSIQRPSDNEYKEGVMQAKKSLEDRLDFVSETLANIYLKQGNKKKAKEIYKQLSLKYPEKKLYFAGQIKNLEK